MVKQESIEAIIFWVLIPLLALKGIYNGSINRYISEQIKQSPKVQITVPANTTFDGISRGEWEGTGMNPALKKKFIKLYQRVAQEEYPSLRTGEIISLPDTNNNGTIDDKYAKGKLVNISPSSNSSNIAKDPLENIIREVSNHQIPNLADKGRKYRDMNQYKSSAEEYKSAVEEIEGIKKKSALLKNEISYLNALEIIYLTKGADALANSWSDPYNIPKEKRAMLENARDMYQKAEALMKRLDTSFMKGHSYNLKLLPRGYLSNGQKRLDEMLGGKK